MASFMALDTWPVWLNAGVFALSAAAVWRAGTRLAVCVDGIASRTGLGAAFTGILLLGGITSLPEIATVSTAAATGNPALAVNNLLGSAAINVLLLAVADAAIGRDALTSVVAKPSTLLQGTLGMLLLTTVAIAATVGDVALFGVGLWTTALFIMCVLALWLSSGYESRHVWVAVGANERSEGEEERGTPLEDLPSLRRLAIKTAAAALVILGAGFALSQTGDALARQTGLGASLIGFVLVGFATSLPELSSILSAVRIRSYELAIGDIFGTNLFNIMLLFLADAAYSGGPVLARAGVFEVVAAQLAVLLTGAFVIGLLERRDRTILRMGYDAFAAIVLFAAGLVILICVNPA